MKHLYFLITCCLVISNLETGNAQIKPDDFLKADGTVLRNKQGRGEIVNLKGTNFGSWLSMEAWIGPLGKAALNRKRWSVSSSEQKHGLTKIIDGDPHTTWNEKSNWIVIDLGENKVFDELAILSGNHSGDLVQVSADNIKWDSIGKCSYVNGKTTIALDAKSYRYIKLQAKGPEKKLSDISEIYAYMDDDFTVRNAMLERFGQDMTDKLFDYYQKLWITDKDIDKVSGMGMNLVRVPVYWMELMDNRGVMKPGAFKQLDWVINACRKRKIYVIIDLHGAPGGLDGYITGGQAFTNELWNQDKWRLWTVNIWKAIAAHYKGNATVAAYDLLNEPVSNNLEYPTKKVYDFLYHAVRSVDPDHLISMGAFYNFDFLGSPASNGWTNVIYQAHYYNTNIKDKASQDGFLDFAIKDMTSHQRDWKVPVYAGEYCFWQYLDNWEKWMKGLNAINASWSNWCYKNRVAEPANWSFFQVNNSPVPDMSFDSVAAIKAKWKKFVTSNFKENTKLINVVKANAGQAATVQ